MDDTIRLYREEIDLYQDQIELLKEKNAKSDETNEILTKKVQDLQKLLGQASAANQDLYSAFDQVRNENQLAIENKQDVSIPNESQRALEAVEEQYLDLARNSVTWISQKDRMIQRISFLERECERYERDNSTLAKQVRHLIHTLEQERGMIIKPGPAKRPRPGNQPITALDVIENNLVTFDSIEQLQAQNQKLLSLVNKLAKEDEEEQLEIENDDIKRLTNEIKELKIKLDEVKSEREQVVNAFNTVLRERDLFKVLLCNTRKAEHLTPEIFQKMVTIAVTSGPGISSEPEDTSDKDARIADLKETIEKLERQINELKEEMKVSKSRAKEELKLKTELLDKEKLDRVVDIKRIEALDENNKVLVEENEKLRTQNHRLILDLEKKSELKEQLEEQYQSKIESVKNLLGNTQQVENMTLEIFERMNSLEEANRIAIAKAQDTSEKDAEIFELKNQILQLRSESDSLRHENQLTVSRLESELHDREVLLQNEKAQINSTNKEIEVLEDKIRELTSELERLENKIRWQSGEIDRLEKQNPEELKLKMLFYLRARERARNIRLARQLRPKLNDDKETDTSDIPTPPAPPAPIAPQPTTGQPSNKIIIKRRN